MKRLILLLAAALMLPSPSPAQNTTLPYVYVDVQFKILVPSDEAKAVFRPSQLTQANAAADTLMTDVNRYMENSWRGLRYRRWGNVLFVLAADVGDSDDADNINDIDHLFQQSGETEKQWHARRPVTLPATLAPAQPAKWKFSNVACNFYILTNWPGGVGWYDTNIIVQGGFWHDPGAHELAHWFTLPHPFTSTEKDTPLPVGSLIEWGDDGFDDTLKDFHQGGHTLDSLSLASFDKKYAELNVLQKAAMEIDFRNHYAKQFYNVDYSSLNAGQKAVIDAYRIRDRDSNDSFSARDAPLLRDLIANGNFGAPGSPVFYDSLSAANKKRVDDLILNIVSYHFGKGWPEFGIFSEKQSDRMCDIISRNTQGRDRSSTRASAIEFGKYFFFGGPTTDAGAPSGSSLRPAATPAAAVSAAGEKDVLIGRPGFYPNPGGASFTITKPLSIRATKAGPITLGSSN